MDMTKSFLSNGDTRVTRSCRPSIIPYMLIPAACAVAAVIGCRKEPIEFPNDPKPKIEYIILDGKKFEVVTFNGRQFVFPKCRGGE